MTDLERRLAGLSPHKRTLLRAAVRGRRAAPAEVGPLREHPEGDPLVAAIAGEPGLEPARAIFLGFGVATQRGVSVGRLPFDSLAMVMVAEFERRRRGAAKVKHMIADEHALVGEDVDPDLIEHAAVAVERELRGVVAAFGYDHYEVFRASAIDDERDLELRLSAAQRCADRYAALEAADVEWARRSFGANVKVGWVMDARRDGQGLDERYFDRVHAELFGATMTAIYCHPGRTLDPRLRRTSPYTLLPGQQRLSLTATEQELESACAGRSMSRHLECICARAEAELGLATGGDLIDRLRVVMARLAAPVNRRPPD